MKDTPYTHYTMIHSHTATRLLGFCAICERDIKLDGEMLVHHGYKRPGDGRIHGDCYAVGMLPYELSVEPVVRYRRNVVAHLSMARETLRRFESGEVRFMARDATRWNAQLQRREDYEEQFVLGVTNFYVFEDERERRTRLVKMEVEALEREHARLTKHIDAWTLKPVRTIEELVEARNAAKERRDADKAARKAARDAKRAAIDAKHAARAEKLASIKKECADVARKLAAEKSEGKDVTKDVDKLGRKIYSKSFPIWTQDLGIDAELIELGLAYKNAGGWTQYRGW